MGMASLPIVIAGGIACALKPRPSTTSNIRSAHGIVAANRGTQASNLLMVYLWPGKRSDRHDLRINSEKSERILDTGEIGGGKKKALSIENWIFKILRVRSRFKERKGSDDDDISRNFVDGGGNGHEVEKDCGMARDSGESSGMEGVEGVDCSTARVSGENLGLEGVGGEDCDMVRVSGDNLGAEEVGRQDYGMDRVSGGNLGVDEVGFDRNSFSKLLRRVTLSEAKLCAKMSYLGYLAYYIPRIKPENLLRYHHLRFVTSSMEINGRNPRMKAVETTVEDSFDGEERHRDIGISANAAFQIAASAAMYIQSHTKGILPFRSSKGSSCRADVMATTDSVTAVVAAGEEEKQAVADDLSSSTSSSPCEWFICDSRESETRFFIIQGSESLASWQANLLFEPVLFEGLDFPVHRGIYEAAKGIYGKLLPHVNAHMAGTRGYGRSLRFAGHSLGGSLALLVSLMLLLRGAVPASSLLPVITFGAPSIMCGGDRLLRELGLPRAHLRAVTIHRDIVPRAFSCNYPSHVTDFLRAINRSFRNHLSLHHQQKVLYSPMGEVLILQPDERISPPHGLLPEGGGLYAMGRGEESEETVREAQSVFMNTPHPLEILSDRGSYGPRGTIQRDHDVKTYFRAMRGVISDELGRLRGVVKGAPKQTLEQSNSNRSSSSNSRISSSSPFVETLTPKP